MFKYFGIYLRRRQASGSYKQSKRRKGGFEGTDKVDVYQKGSRIVQQLNRLIVYNDGIL